MEMKKVLAIITVGVFAVGLYSVIRDRESLKVKDGMLKLVDDLELTVPQRARVRLLVEAEHVAVFDKSLDLSKSRGAKFDAKLYQDEIFSRIIAHTRSDEPELAEKLSMQQRHHELVVREK